ncbi:SDR family oxidoreductase [Kribbella sp. DT2]|uniref:SDR family oxidoreductase n=1 Tax=Kribbella sp. DT2 TaxID=3393427 RepID=UPI003CE68098
MTNRTAVITGAASGIGAAIALRLASEGAAVALIARRKDRLEELAARIFDSGGTAVVVPADVTDEESVVQAAATVRDRLGEVDLLVNNAGRMQLAPYGDFPLAEWKQLVDVNVNGVLNTVHAFLPDLLRSAESRTTDLVNVSSVAADRYMDGMATYGATKSAVSYLTRALRAELAGKGIRFTNLEPGMTGGTELGDNFPAEIQGPAAALAAALPAIEAEDVAEVLAFIVSRPRNVNLPRVLVQPAKEI